MKTKALARMEVVSFYAGVRHKRYNVQPEQLHQIQKAIKFNGLNLYTPLIINRHFRG
jgi:hypothetical protein